MYQVIVLPKALLDLKNLDKVIARRITDKLTWLSENAETVMPLSLKGSFSGLYKLKVGDWRVIYEINHNNKKVAVHKVGHRSEVYK